MGAFAGLARTAALHYEKLDGSGYPWGVQEAELDEGARVLAVADIYDALTSERPYRGPLPAPEAIGIIARERGAKLWAPAVDALSEMV